MVRLGIIIIACSLIGLLPVKSPAAVSGKGYDVSYLWHSDRSQVELYRQRVAGILGLQVARNLKIVSRSGLYGLIYVRGGDSAGATRVAKVHSRLLKSRGLEKAAPIRSSNWVYLKAGTGRVQKVAIKSSKPTKINKTSKTHIKDYAKPQQSQELEALLEKHIKKLRRQGKISADERTGWAVYDFTTGEKLVTINENVQFQAASLIKPFVAAAFFHKVEKGNLIYGPKSRRHMERMIQKSSNSSTNWVMRQVGGPKAVERILEKHYPNIYKDTYVVEYIPSNGRTYRNKASIDDYSRFLNAMWNNKIPGSKEIKRLMSLPGSDRLYTGAKDIPYGTKVYNKTGSTSRVCADMGILIAKGKNGRRYPYTIVGVIEKQNRARNYTSWIQSRGDVIRDVSNLVYQDIASRHSL
jgi:beta-lactamase class A